MVAGETDVRKYPGGPGCVIINVVVDFHQRSLLVKKTQVRLGAKYN